MDVFTTVVSGVSVYVLGQIIIKFFVEPTHAIKAVIGEVASTLMLNANIYANPKPPGDERQGVVFREFRELSCKLQSAACCVPLYRWIWWVFGLPRRSKLNTALKELIGLSNGHDAQLANQGILNCYSAQRVKQALGIYIAPEDKLNPDREKSFLSTKE